MRRARIRTTHATPALADAVAGAVEPDNTDSMSTVVDGRAVVTTIERETTGGLHSSVDDYVVNLSVADRLTTWVGDDSDRDRDDGERSARDGGEATAATKTETETTIRSGVEPTDDHTDTTHNTHE